MSTNFYLTPKEKTPIAAFPALHIGLRTGGNEFLFQSFEPKATHKTMVSLERLWPQKLKREFSALSVRSRQEWVELAQYGQIEDEYGRVYSADEFNTMLENNRLGATWSNGRKLKPAIGDYRLEREAAKKERAEVWRDPEGFAFKRQPFE